MSLYVSADLLDAAHRDEVDGGAFVDCIRRSLPYAWSVVARLVDEVRAGAADGAANGTPPPDDTARGQLLRLAASDAMRDAVERHFDIRLAFQNCHRLAAFPPGAKAAYDDFVTARSQILNQTPELVDC